MMILRRTTHRCRDRSHILPKSLPSHLSAANLSGSTSSNGNNSKSRASTPQTGESSNGNGDYVPKGSGANGAGSINGASGSMGKNGNVFLDCLVCNRAVSNICAFILTHLCGVFEGEKDNDLASPLKPTLPLCRLSPQSTLLILLHAWVSPVVLVEELQE